MCTHPRTRIHIFAHLQGCIGVLNIRTDKQFSCLTAFLDKNLSYNYTYECFSYNTLTPTLAST